jgi:hypothetical protein
MTLLIHPVAALTIATFIVITAVGWFAVPGPRWALVTLGASGTLLLIAVTNVAFPLFETESLAVTSNAALDCSDERCLPRTDQNEHRIGRWRKRRPRHRIRRDA